MFTLAPHDRLGAQGEIPQQRRIRLGEHSWFVAEEAESADPLPVDGFERITGVEPRNEVHAINSITDPSVVKHIMYDEGTVICDGQLADGGGAWDRRQFDTGGGANDLFLAIDDRDCRTMNAEQRVT